MTTVGKLVYLIRRGKITLDRVAPQYREQVAAELGTEGSTPPQPTGGIVQNREDADNG